MQSNGKTYVALEHFQKNIYTCHSWFLIVSSWLLDLAIIILLGYFAIFVYLYKGHGSYSFLKTIKQLNVFMVWKYVSIYRQNIKNRSMLFQMEK